MRRLAIAAGDGRRHGFALEPHQKCQHLVIEHGDELPEIRLQYEACVLRG